MGKSALVTKAANSTKTSQPKIVYVDDLPVEVTRKRIKNVNLRVRADASVTVSVPHRATDDYIKAFIRERRDWINSAVAERAGSPCFQAGQATPEQTAEWHRVVSASVPALIEAWEPIMGVKAGKVVYRNMTSRWGSCQPTTGRICINTRLALYPPECLEYVVVHELCHLLQRGHGPRFQQLMDSFMPDWRERRAQLR